MSLTWMGDPTPPSTTSTDVSGCYPISYSQTSGGEGGTVTILAVATDLKPDDPDGVLARIGKV